MGATVHALRTRPQPFMARYGISRCLGRGPIDAVYEGVRRGTTERVAIRRVHPHLVDERARKHLVKTAQNGTTVQHPNVIRIEEVADLEGDIFLVSKLVEGATLARLVAKKPLPRRIALRIVLDACAGLAAIHAARGTDGTRLVHCDVSPANIIVGIDGISRLADFGVAKQLEDVDDAAPLRQGKSGYTAPEYILTGLFDARSDVFALGIVLWELLAARRLFEGTTDEEVLHRALFEDAPSLIGFGIAPEIAAVVARAVARPASYRFSSASKLEVELEDVAKDRIATHAEVALFVAALEAPAMVADEERDSTLTRVNVQAMIEEEYGTSRTG